MIRFILVLMLLLSFLDAKTYRFDELRYSDALDKSASFSGEISFLKDGLSIKYDQSNKVLEYLQGELGLSENGEVVELDDFESSKIIQYFEVLMLLYSDDEEKIKEQFELVKEEGKQILTPRLEIKNYIKKIELVKDKNELKELKLFLSNDDNIAISIKNEIY